MIEIKHLSKTFQMKDGAVNALKDINLTIPDGSIYGIIGMSGAGKSTLVRCINLLERPTEGSVVIDGTAMETLSPAALRERRREITMIFQQFNLLMQRSCLKNICFPMELAGVKKADAEKRAKELLEMVGLPDKANAYPAQLSGGQKQRIAIARALATNPKVLLCDEATSALDPNTTHSILTLIKDINQKLGITVVVITHQMSVVEEICDSVAILDGGVVMEEGSVQEIFANPKTAAAKRLVAPNGGSAARDLSSFAPDDHVVRVTFNGSSTAKPLVASLAAEKGILVSVLSADTRDLSGQCYGSMLLKLPADVEQAKQAGCLYAQPARRDRGGGDRRMSIADYGFAIWETFYVTVLSTAFALVLGLPLGVLLVAGDKDGVLPLPGWLMHILNIVINILRSVPFLILMICVFPLTRAIVGTTVGTKATIVPLVVAAFPFVARLVETSLRELDEGVVEAAQSMGATPFQIITKVMIPECLPGLISSMTTALTTILGYSAMSGVIGGGGLGKIALSYGYYRYQTDIMIVCVILLVLMVQVFQSVGHLLGDPERQAPAEVKECRKAFHGDGKVSLNHTARRFPAGNKI